MTFKANKCKCTRIMHSRDNTSPNYTLGGKSLKSVQSVKDLGVTLLSNLSWNKHVGITTNKANKVLGIIKRTVGTGNPDTFSILYKSLVRPILKYAAPVRSPYLVKNIRAIEKVQRRASRLALNQGRGEMSYEDRCKFLDWTTLSIRRDYLSLIECYKIVFGLNENINFSDYFEFSNFLVPDQIIGSNCTTNQQKSIVSSTPFLSELKNCGIVYQQRLLRRWTLVRLRET